MRKALRDFDRKRKAEGVDTLLEDHEQSLNSVKCQGIWENIQVMTQEIVKEINVMKDERELEDMPELMNDMPEQMNDSEDEDIGWDDVNEVQIPLELVKAARGEEVQFMKSRSLWTVVPTSECIVKTGKRPVSVRWVDTNKGRDGKLEIRSRLVARDFKGDIKTVTTFSPRRHRWRQNACY